MRRQTVRVATSTKRRISITTASSVRHHCAICNRYVETMSVAEAVQLASALSGAAVLHHIALPDGDMRICRDSAWIQELPS